MAGSLRVLVTRPEPLATALADELAQRGYEALIHPFLSYERAGFPLPSLPPSFVVALTSQIAPRYAQPDALELCRLRAKACYCVGQKTAQAAHVAGFTHIITGPGHGKGLAELIISNEGTETAVLHIGGQEADGDLALALSAHGYDYIRWPVYRTCPELVLPAELLAVLKGKTLDAALFLSARTAQAYVDALRMAQIPDTSQDVVACALSPKVAAVLMCLPWKRLAVASRPDQTALIDCLLEHCPAQGLDHD